MSAAVVNNVGVKDDEKLPLDEKPINVTLDPTLNGASPEGANKKKNKKKKKKAGMYHLKKY